MTIEIIEVLNRKQLKYFVKFPLYLYKNNPYYVPTIIADDLNTLDTQKNPAFHDCEARYWLAYNNGKVVGRVAAILDKPHIKKWGQKYLRFSWFDFIDDIEVSQLLMLQVEDWAKELKLEAVHGPLGFTDLDREGMLVDGYNEVATLATFYNHPYYPEHMERMGYRKDIDWIEFEIVVPSTPNEKIARAASIVAKRHNLKLAVPKNKKELLDYGLELFDLLVEEYKHLYGTHPLNKDQINSYIKQYIGLVPLDMIPIIVDEDEKIVAFGIAIPSLSKALQNSKGRLFPFGWYYLLKALKNNDQADLMLVAVKKEWQGAGVNAILMDQMSKVFTSRRITKLESNPELETNLNVQSLWKLYETRQHKRRRIFIKSI